MATAAHRSAVRLGPSTALALSGAAHAAEMTIFEHPRFGGAQVTLRGYTPDIAHTGFTDRASSMVVDVRPLGALHRRRLQGTCAVFTRGEYPTLDRSLNDRFSSAREVGSYGDRKVQLQRLGARQDQAVRPARLRRRLDRSRRRRLEPGGTGFDDRRRACRHPGHLAAVLGARVRRQLSHLCARPLRRPRPRHGRRCLVGAPGALGARRPGGDASPGAMPAPATDRTGDPVQPTGTEGPEPRRCRRRVGPRAARTSTTPRVDARRVGHLDRLSRRLLSRRLSRVRPRPLQPEPGRLRPCHLVAAAERGRRGPPRPMARSRRGSSSSPSPTCAASASSSTARRRPRRSVRIQRRRRVAHRSRRHLGALHRRRLGGNSPCSSRATIRARRLRPGCLLRRCARRTMNLHLAIGAGFADRRHPDPDRAAPAQLHRRDLPDHHRPARLFGGSFGSRPAEALVRREIAPLAGRQVAEDDGADPHPLQAEHLQADQLAHAPDLPLLAFASGRSAAARRWPTRPAPAAAPRRRG